jgi:hypothetical protein
MSPGLSDDRFSSLVPITLPTHLHPHRTPSTPPHTFPLQSRETLPPPPISGSPQAETGSPVHCHGWRRRHWSRHDGAVAHLARLPGAAPRCRDLSDSSLADRAGHFFCFVMFAMMTVRLFLCPAKPNKVICDCRMRWSLTMARA